MRQGKGGECASGVVGLCWRHRLVSGCSSNIEETITLARTVPYRPNSMLVFVNSRAAHGAALPADASLDERYTYQFYVKPLDGDLKKLLRKLPEDARKAWDEIL